MGRIIDVVGAVNEWVGRVSGLLILLVVLIILKEVIFRSGFNAPSTWADESMTYVAGFAYVLAGGYTLLHRRHVAVDVLYQPIAGRSRKLKAALDVAAFVLLAGYCVVLIHFGWQLAELSLQQREGSGTIWNPPIWPVKMAIPLAAALLLLQGAANLIQDLKRRDHAG